MPQGLNECERRNEELRYKTSAWLSREGKAAISIIYPIPLAPQKDKIEGKFIKISSVREAEVHRDSYGQVELKKTGRCGFSSTFGTQ